MHMNEIILGVCKAGCAEALDARASLLAPRAGTSVSHTLALDE